MTDLLVKLYDLPLPAAPVTAWADGRITVRRAMASEKRRMAAWVQGRFGDGWASECEIAFTRCPIACLVAIVDQHVAGFACYDTTGITFFGPIGIDTDFRGQGIGRAVLLAALRDMAERGYAYAIIGGAGPVGFFERCAGAHPIPGSTPGIYRQMVTGS